MIQNLSEIGTGGKFLLPVFLILGRRIARLMAFCHDSLAFYSF
jgi:hypothetical protein